VKIRTFYSIENGVYKVSVNTEDWSENDRRLIYKFGEPEIETGGTIDYVPEEGPIEHLVLDSCHRRIYTGSPITRTFDSRDAVHAKEFANAWADRTIGQIGTEYAALHAKSDDFTREIVNTLSAG